MQEKNHSTKNLLIAVAVLITIGVGGYMYVNRVPSNESTDSLVGVPINTGGTASVDGDLLTALRQLRRITLDESIFTNRVFISLSDFGKDIGTQPAGRVNPFAPLDVSTTVFTPTATSTR